MCRQNAFLYPLAGKFEVSLKINFIFPIFTNFTLLIYAFFIQTYNVIKNYNKNRRTRFSSCISFIHINEFVFSSLLCFYFSYGTFFQSFFVELLFLLLSFNFGMFFFTFFTGPIFFGFAFLNNSLLFGAFLFFYFPK